MHFSSASAELLWLRVEEKSLHYTLEWWRRAECLGSLFRGYLGIVSRISGASRLIRGVKYAPKPLRHQSSGPDQSQKKPLNCRMWFLPMWDKSVIKSESDEVMCSSAHQTKALWLTNSTILYLYQSTYRGALELVVNCIPLRQKICWRTKWLEFTGTMTCPFKQSNWKLLNSLI